MSSVVHSLTNITVEEFLAGERESEVKHEYVREGPVLIVEVLSRSTRRFDKTEKRAEYLTLPSLQEYILIEQDFAEVEVQRRSNQWRSEYYYLGQDIHFESVDVTVSVEAIYQRVDNKDVEVFLLAQQAEALDS